MNSFPQNPFTHTAFWGRQNELRTIYSRLLSQPAQCCAIIGEMFIGKTTLLSYLSNPQASFILDNREIKDRFTFVYLDCNFYVKLAEMENYASARFWWDLYNASWTRLQPEAQPTVSEPRVKADISIDTALEIKFALEGLIRDHKRTVIFVLDNFEGVAHLPPRDSEWLRSMVQFHCAYVVSSRYLLYLLYQYHPESWESPSPLWNLFSDPIYLGLMKEEEAMNFILQEGELESFWKEEDIEFIKRMAGRHPELIRIACARLYEQRLQSRQTLKGEEYEFLEFSIDSGARPICIQLWRGLADSELWNVPKVVGKPGEKETRGPSPYQEDLIRMAKGEDPTDKNVLFVLEQRGLIERRGGKWHVFAEVMRKFVLEQEQVRKSAELTVSNRTTVPYDTGVPVFAHLEGKVYDYLKAHVRDVCDREEIKRAVWPNSPPSNSALQKIIERIREKIEPDPSNPRYLIAARGQGYILREDPTGSSAM